MNSKIIAAGVVVALCAVALIGVGYAYNATFTNNDNLISYDADYVVITNDTLTKNDVTLEIKNTELKIPFNTETNYLIAGDTITYSYEYKPDVVGWTPGSDNEYTKEVTLSDKITLKVNTKEASTPTGSFKLTVDPVELVPSSFTPTAVSGTGIEKVVISLGGVTQGGTTNSDGTFTGDDDALVDLSVTLKMTITVKSTTSLTEAPKEFDNQKFTITYMIAPA